MTRKEAKAAGALYYEGRPCSDCGGTQRYTKSKACVNCNGKRGKTYAGKPCPNGHAGLRYVTSRNCVDCAILNAQASAAKRKLEEHKSPHNPGHRGLKARKHAPAKPHVSSSDFIKPPDLARLMAGR